MKTTPHLSIGAMAQANGVTPRALRVYQQKGIIEPSHVDDQTGNRYYDIHQSRKIDMVHELQNIGFSLDEIEAVNRSGSLDELCVKTRTHLAEIIARQEELALARKAAEELLDSCTQYQNGELLDQIVLERLPERHIITFDLPDTCNLGYDNAEMCTEWEWALRTIKKTMQRRGYPAGLFRQVSSSVPYENVRAGIPQITYAFVPVDPSYGACFADARPIPAGYFLSMYGTEAYSPDGIAVGTRTLQRFLDYAAAKKLVPCGDFYEEVICRWPTLFGQEGSMLFRLTLPVHRVQRTEAAPSSHEGASSQGEPAPQGE